MKIGFYIPVVISTIVLIFTSSCKKDLDREPFYDPTSANVYNDFANYKQVLAKLYAGLAVTGQRGPDGRPDISGIDEGASNYLRQYWLLQELPTDEAVITWNDPGLPNLHLMNWTAGNEFVSAMYYRIYYQVALCNEFIRETNEGRLQQRNINGANLELAKQYRTEARFLRALSYWHALDLFGNVPFVTEQSTVGTALPPQTTKEALFHYIESELLDLENSLVDARSNEYGRADKACAWMLLAKLYQNAPIYINQPHYADVINYCQKIISAGYSLETDYKKLFLADNHVSNEIIFPITFDGLHTRSWGGTTFLVHGPVGGSMNAATFGINGGWAGLRTTKNMVQLFEGFGSDKDSRRMFYTDGQKLEIDNLATFTDGYPIVKFKNITSHNVPGSDPSGNFVDTDFPLFRLADVYLMYAEAVLRGGGGSHAQAVQLINQVRQRAYGDTSGNIAPGALTLDFILDERARELSWEASRRTDLIRFHKFTTPNYLWPWKGSVKEGKEVEPFRVLFPLPASDITANPNLVQNTGY